MKQWRASEPKDTSKMGFCQNLENQMNVNTHLILMVLATLILAILVILWK